MSEHCLSYFNMSNISH